MCLFRKSLANAFFQEDAGSKEHDRYGAGGNSKMGSNVLSFHIVSVSQVQHMAAFSLDLIEA
jgi:hypothetical protein